MRNWRAYEFGNSHCLLFCSPRILLLCHSLNSLDSLELSLILRATVFAEASRYLSFENEMVMSAYT